MSKSVYMVINHIQRPAAGVNMSVRGNAGNPDNWETFENMFIMDNVKRNALLTASVVIDLLAGKVLKNRFETDDSTTFREYVDRYQSDISEALKQWGRQDPNNFLRLKALADAADTAKIKAAAKEMKADDESNPN